MIIIKHNYNSDGIDITVMKEITRKNVDATRRDDDEENGSEI